MCIPTPWGVICVDGPVLIAIATGILTVYSWLTIRINRRKKNEDRDSTD